MKTEGYVLKERPYRTPETPPDALEDMSGWDNDGTFKGAGEPDWVRLPSGLWINSFDGVDDVITIPHAPSHCPTHAITVMAWVNPTTFLLNEYDTIIAKRNTNDVSQSISYNLALNYPAVGNIRVFFYTSVDALDWTTSLVLTTGEWQLCGFTYDAVAGSTVVFINESNATSGAITGTILYDTSDLYIGSRWLTTFNWHGYISKPRILNNVLSESQIYSIYQSERGWFNV